MAETNLDDFFAKKDKSKKKSKSKSSPIDRPNIFGDFEKQETENKAKKEKKKKEKEKSQKTLSSLGPSGQISAITQQVIFIYTNFCTSV